VLALTPLIFLWRLDITAQPVGIIDLTPFKTNHHAAQDTADKCSAQSLAIVGRVVLATLEELEGQFGKDRTGMQQPQGAGGQG